MNNPPGFSVSNHLRDQRSEKLYRAMLNKVKRVTTANDSSGSVCK